MLAFLLAHSGWYTAGQNKDVGQEYPDPEKQG
jgi:hypothetical protein